VSTPFICPVCGNDDPKYIGRRNNGLLYCRRCISFQGKEAKASLPRPKPAPLCLSYSLSKEQETLAERAVENFKRGIDTLIYAVCGSGKTEISYPIIQFAMERGLTVGFALPRRDVVIELFARLKSAFPKNKIVAVYGGHSEVLEGDCIILTTHQLFRYEKYFDLLVMDEIDAFPFKGNEALIAMFKRSLRGHCLMMSATPSKAVVKLFKSPGHELLTLHTRFHRHPIPVPVIKIIHNPAKVAFLIAKLREYRKKNKRCFVFVPTIGDSEILFSLVRLFAPKGNYVSSKKSDRAKVIDDFKKGRYLYLITTAVLERGITVKDLQVIVYGADSSIYDAASLIQISGRAGRKADAPKGDVIFVADKESDDMVRAIKEIAYCNSFL
jgi:competence protein ComFA